MNRFSIHVIKNKNERNIKKVKNTILTLQISESDNILNYRHCHDNKVNFKHEIRKTGGISN